MNYYIFNHDWNHECLKEENIPTEYEEISLDFGIPYDNLPDIKLTAKNNVELPSFIPNHQRYLFFDKKIRNIISKFGIDYIEYFNVEVYNEKHEIICTQYKTANILKVVDAIDFNKSTLKITDGDITDILDLRLNCSNINNEIMFRLKHCEVLLVLREDLAQTLVDERCYGIELHKAEGFRI